MSEYGTTRATNEFDNRERDRKKNNRWYDFACVPKIWIEWLTMKWKYGVSVITENCIKKIENLLIQWWKWNVTNAQKGTRKKNQQNKHHTQIVWNEQTNGKYSSAVVSLALKSYTYMKMIQDTKQTRNNNIMLLLLLIFFFVFLKPLKWARREREESVKKSVQKMTKRRKHMRTAVE